MDAKLFHAETMRIVKRTYDAALDDALYEIANVQERLARVYENFKNRNLLFTYRDGCVDVERLNAAVAKAAKVQEMLNELTAIEKFVSDK